MSRNFKFDNTKCILIFAVVLGHFFEQFSGVYSKDLSRIIYSFHMPAFIFITGYFATYKPEKILKGLVCPYILFQVLYIVFNYFVIHNAEEFVLQFTTPHWILWYLVAMIGYYLLVPFISVEGKWKKVAIIVGAFLISLVSGYDKTIGFYLSIARFCTFLPFFVVGFYMGHSDGVKIKSNWKVALVSGVLVTGLMVYLCNSTIMIQQLHGAYYYEKLNYGPDVRLLLLVMALLWITFLMSSVTSKKLPVISMIGENTLPIFLLHGFITRFSGYIYIFKFNNVGNIFLSIGLTVVILLVLGNPYVKKVFKLL